MTLVISYERADPDLTLEPRRKNFVLQSPLYDLFNFAFFVCHHLYQLVEVGLYFVELRRFVVVATCFNRQVQCLTVRIE